MSEHDDGGPAFPVTAQVPNGYGNYIPETQYGMSLRDYFAVKAMTSILSADTPKGRSTTAEKLVATASYIMADAMLAARG